MDEVAQATDPITVRGYRSGLEVVDGEVHIWNKAAKSDVRFAITEIVTVTWKKPGFARGYVAVQTPDCPPPAGMLAAANHPQTVVLALGEWKNAARFIRAAKKWVAGNDHVSPFAGIDATIRKDKRVRDKLPGLRGMLDPDEAVEALLAGTYDSDMFGQDTIRSGVLAATDRRVVLYGTRTSGYDSESIRYERISSVEAGRTMTGGKVTVHTSNDKLAMSMINVGDTEAFVALVRSRAGRPDDSASATPAADSGGLADELAKLGELHESGVLDADEFAAAKARLLQQ
ncbi:hypothetical protein DVS28_a2911 [Euzebya pacifica]|uniref:Short C-terminal domain-containing protein n=1 Tax=Euzebya pacifica TaxID=1608957 RepID=A0A346XZE3_9ACTN|nr:PH domain-containing protein [Euzebya pacifica]AXV07590.1 hypothetical protein DVS28_a2911 [Euzebya pacifica]